jgi:translation elongation factor EF-1alpha
MDRVGVSIPNLKCMQIPRGTVLSEKANHPAQRLDYALGFFLTVNYKGLLKSGSILYFVSNRISRKCRIEIDSLIRMDREVLIDKTEASSIKSKAICFIRIYPVDELVLDDPAEFPEFGMAQLWDNCQTVGIGKIFKIVEGDLP